MSNSRKGEGLPVKPWRDVIHDFKNKINPAVLIAESLLGEVDLSSQAEKNDHNLLLVLFQILQEISRQNILDLTTYKKSEPDEASINKKIKNYQNLLAAALEKADGYLKNQQLADADEKSDAHEMIQSIMSSQAYLDPGRNSKAMSLKDIVKKNILNHNFALRKKDNSVSLIFSPSTENPKVKGEYINYIDSILENCLANANRFTANGEIEVRIHCARDEAKLLIVIKDTGAGMPPEILKRVRRGELGVTVGGNGVGLAGVYLMTQRYGGDIVVDSSVDSVHHGSTFTFKLPALLILEDENQLSARNVNESFSLTEAKGDKENERDTLFSIYFIDDALVNRKLFLRSIAPLMKNRKNLRVLTIADPQEIIDMSKEEIEKIVGIVTDVNLANDVNGMEVARDQIHPRLTGEVPIFTYSGNNITLVPDGKIRGHILKGAGVKDALELFLKLVDRAAAEKIILSQQEALAKLVVSASATPPVPVPVLPPAPPLVGASSSNRAISLPGITGAREKSSSRTSSGAGAAPATERGKLFSNKNDAPAKKKERSARTNKKLLNLPKINLIFNFRERGETAPPTERRSARLTKKRGSHS